ncbi:MAG: GNAT family N-acetyltransferase [Lachnospiraceae bacterium]|nr:GNAT family N-acetyltransferase [Lachnospiraceae bacterium]
MRTAIRVTEEWQRAGVHYVRTQAMCRGFQIPLEAEFGEDTPEDEYILILEGIYPVSTCRLHYLDEDTCKIERVATLEEYRGQHYGKEAILEAERWMAEKGISKAVIHSREAALGFYQKLGYVPDLSRAYGSGAFRCIYTEKNLSGSGQNGRQHHGKIV